MSMQNSIYLHHPAYFDCWFPASAQIGYEGNAPTAGIYNKKKKLIRNPKDFI